MADAGLSPTAVLRRMVDIPSPTGEEAELAAYVVTTARRLGMRAHLDAAGNAVCTTGCSDGPTVMLLGHLDTVPGGPSAEVRDGVLTGRGTVDAKGPLSAMLWAAARYTSTELRVVVVGAVGEEGDSPGAWHLLDGDRPDAVVIGEPSGVNTAVVGFKGIVRLRLDARRPPGHTSRLEPKATEVAADFWRDVRDHLADRYPASSHERAFDRAIPALVGMAGDLCAASVTISCRVPVGFDAAAFRCWLRTRAGSDTLTVLEDVPAVRTGWRDPVVSALSEAIRERGARPAAKVKLGTSDMNVVIPVWGVPAAAYGPGDARLDHTDEERVDLSDYLAAIDVLGGALRRLPAALRRAAPVEPVR